METWPDLTQSPAPGKSQVMYCGDLVCFTLTLSKKTRGMAWVRTNLGSAAIARKETIKRVEKNEIKLEEDWYDIPMQEKADLVYEVVLPLYQTGFFQAKCFFSPHNSLTPIWPLGDNCVLNVAPASTCCANIIYNAFVRQFGKSKYPGSEQTDLSDAIHKLDDKGYAVIPQSGTFRDLTDQVDFIFSRLGCRILQLLPIHPTPTTYARMGRFGSPYAALNFTQVDPALARFDPLATPLEQFMELVDRVHFYNGYLFMDIAINHTGWAAAIHETHPEWLVRDEQGKIEAPGAWGVTWEDLTKLDYSNHDLWHYMADVFLLWCHRGVDGFRCDAGYMVPVDAWEYIVAKVRQQFPETLFFLEGLGGPIQTTRDILTRANFNFAYSELFQNYTREAISHYLVESVDLSRTSGMVIHFAETHDNNRLASVSTVYAKMRTSLCALFSVCGGFGFANGVEWFADQKIDVHESNSLNWGDETNQVAHISKLNLILKHHPAYFAQTRLALIQKNQSECLVLLRHNEQQDKVMLILANLDCENAHDASWKKQDVALKQTIWYDLISGSPMNTREKDDYCMMQLTRGQVLALTPDPDDLNILGQNRLHKSLIPERVYLQRLKASVLAVHAFLNGYQPVTNMTVEQEALLFASDPVEFIRALNTTSKESRVIVFNCETDLNRQLMIPPGFFLLVKSRFGFRADLFNEKKSLQNSLTRLSGHEEGIPTRDGTGYFALFQPIRIKARHREYTLGLRVFQPHETMVKKVPLLYLAPFNELVMHSSFKRKEIVNAPFLKLLGTTRTGGMMRAAAFWGRLDSRYDALLGANMDPTIPENRWMVLSRCRIWAVYQGYSRELSLDCLETFTFSYDHGGKWLFHVPTSEGKYYALTLCLSIDSRQNHVTLSILRSKSHENTSFFLDDDKLVTIIVRPDIEDRRFHEVVKAYMGPEKKWPESIQALDNGFLFSLSNGKTLQVMISPGEFIHEPEWHYMIHRSLEAQRGLDPESDLFSPGYFKASCSGGRAVVLNAAVVDNPDRLLDFAGMGTDWKTRRFKNRMPLFTALCKSLDTFVVDRGTDKSVIAGFPWFLDWGRDSLIFCRSLIELGRFSDAKAILRLFARFERNGTLPNMICGNDAANIETSDAPLWFFACCKDLVEKEKSHDFLNEVLDNRKIRDILLSIAHWLVQGTHTGVKADPETLLLYSPGHFTWMDTNFPAGSPRQGYPVEIQALWYNALVLMASVDAFHKNEWHKKAATVQDAVQSLFYDEQSGFFADCLHSDGPTGAKKAVPDDALRPNQLFLVTLDVIQDQKIAQKCVETCQELLVPGGIRSLADRKLETPINIFYNGKLIKDPHYPYSGEYKGDEDTLRKPAYHNGTAWTWQFPLFCEAWAMVFGQNSHATALAWLGSVMGLMRKGAAGYVPEILDGNYPHTPRGCDAQAWGSSEAARVMHKLLD